jgi:hypothetical protein
MRAGQVDGGTDSVGPACLLCGRRRQRECGGIHSWRVRMGCILQEAVALNIKLSIINFGGES